MMLRRHYRSTSLLPKSTRSELMASTRCPTSSALSPPLPHLRCLQVQTIPPPWTLHH
ncbi:hypothetical protein RHGRI_032620 [Rhododendron griersonianum]|uniref:Uncharacterized protein n=1 Tax=Rhododendron griersonianum TaxID=479676 RepID=A0AAV6ICM5_9ERIC|nr:hypothetical protein RHGRI_032620 [Rhododendron griersonianum]